MDIDPDRFDEAVLALRWPKLLPLRWSAIILLMAASAGGGLTAARPA
jgi:hypothetical protein